ncbi:hypothetical protein GN244_ATG20808 [Phytophthora infestans]|uniref:Uncharacterized protein n=1 Tax=Phytophthora infestans TaxID=4787 RepID=A0A833W2X8_PHYIN|nr:hypothetical protein GN244_ATG20808 [Phytophthora infestans]
MLSSRSPPRPGMGEPARASGPETRSRDKGRKRLRLAMVGGDVAPPGPNHAPGGWHTKSTYMILKGSPSSERRHLPS